MSGVGGAPNPDDLEPEHTEGFKVGEKKTIDEYNKLGILPSPLILPWRTRISALLRTLRPLTFSRRQ
jgi:hypothetical protein